LNFTLPALVIITLAMLRQCRVLRSFAISGLNVRLQLLESLQPLAIGIIISLWLVAPLAGLAQGAEKFTVATYNVENYLLAASGTRPAKSSESQAKVRESIRAMAADVLGLQEIGGTNALLELRASLQAEGLDYPYWEHVAAWDTNIQVAVLSKFPIIASRSHTRDGFLLGGRRFRVSRGFAEVDIRVNPRYTFTLLVAHLKSKRPIPEADQNELREQEALMLREKIDARLRLNPNSNLIVVGDLNDVKDAISTRAVLGKGKSSLVDVRPAERNGDDLPPARPQYAPRNISWTYFYGKEDSYSRIDYILLSRGMARELDRGRTYVLALPNWGLASDHRPIIAGFVAKDQ
jgi:endonuclease/exonuclease/phosphatase family metal-dependent hydrolase